MWTSLEFTSRQKRALIIIASVGFFYLIFGFLGAPLIVRSLLEKTAATAIGRRVAVGQVRVNPLTLSLTLRGLNVRGKGHTPFIQLEEAYANLQLSSIFRWAVVLKTVRLVNPDLHLERTGAATFNFSDIGHGHASSPTAEQADTDRGGFGWVVHALDITGGRVTLDDQVVSVTHRVADLNLSVANFSSRAADLDNATDFALSARVNDAGLALQGQGRPLRVDHQLHASARLTAVALTHYLPYVSLPPNLVIQSFNLQTETEIDFSVLADGRPQLVIAGQTALTDVRVTDGRGDAFVHHPHLAFDLLPSKVLTGELRFGKVESDRPEYNLKRLSSGRLYLPFLAETAYEKAEEKAKTDDSGEFQPVVTIDALNLTRAVVHLSDLSNQEPFTTTISRLDLAVENFGLNSDRMAAYRLAMQTGAGEALDLEGTASLTPLQAVGEVSLTDIQVPRYAPYVEDRFGFQTASGRVSLSGNYRLRQTVDSTQVSFSGIHLIAESLDLQDKRSDAPIVSLGQMELADTTVDLVHREISLGRLSIDDTQLFCRREKDGTLNLVKAFVPSSAHTQAAGEAARTVVASPTPTPAAPFVVKLASIDLSDVTVDVADFEPRVPVHLRMDNLSLSATDLSTAEGQAGRAQLAFDWSGKGRIQINGDVTIQPLALDLTVNAESMDMRPFQPYLSEHTGLIVTQGLFNTNGRFQLTGNDSGGPPVMAYQGDAEIGHFASIDRKNADDFLEWKGLRFDTLKIHTAPLSISVDQIRMADFFARVIVDPQGSLNLISVLDQPASASPDSPPPAESAKGMEDDGAEKNQPDIRIDQIHLSGGDVDFSDQFIKPNFRARFEKLKGQISGLASIEEKRADVRLEGVWGRHAPVKISGQINPLIDNPFMDLGLTISDIELSPFSPYSGKYIGYILEKGKLTFNVDYLLQDRQLEGKNSVYINQLTLGDAVDSPDAVSLPIKLVVALLKDREGNIQLDLPLSGSLDDPQFKVGKMILTVLKNLLVKIVSSPFTALSSLAGGGGEELSYLAFDAGDSTIGAENSAKLDNLAKILYERPALNLDIQGTIAPQADQKALQSALLENRLRARKLQQMMESGKSAVPLEDVSLSAEERGPLLTSVFDSAAIPAPVDDSGKALELTVPIMEHLLREHTPVTENDFRHLANARAFNVKNYILTHGQVERERLFIVEPRMGPEESKSEPAASGRVIFSLK